MYDKFALRKDADNRTDKLLGLLDFDNPSFYWNTYLKKRKFFFKPGEDLVYVNSCFGGMVIYKKRIIGDCMYDSIRHDCEHVVFHECIKKKNNGTIVLNPTQVIRYRHYFWDTVGRFFLGQYRDTIGLFVLGLYQKSLEPVVVFLFY